MSIERTIKCSLGAALMGSVFAIAMPAHAAEEWYFYVENESDSRIVKLQVSENKKKWGDFNIGKGIAPGKSAKLVWDASTDDESCEQWIRAKFADGSVSEPSKTDFCEDLDTPLVFE
jgi:hypothetical protein